MATLDAPPPVTSMRVLHIDDDPDYLAITKMYLESFDPTMEVVSSLSSVESPNFRFKFCYFPVLYPEGARAEPIPGAGE